MNIFAFVLKKFQELETKDIELRNLHTLTEKAAKLSILNDNRTQKEIANLRKSLIQERNFKLDAYQRVDELQSQVYDFEAIENLSARSQTTISSYKSTFFTYIKKKFIGTTKRKMYKLLNLVSSQVTAASKMSSLPFPRVNYDKRLSQTAPAELRPKTVRI